MSIKSAPLYYPPAQRKVRKERSDFAVEGLAQIFVGAGALDSPLGGARFVFFLQAMQGDKGCRGVGTSGAPSPTNALCGYSGLL